MSEWVRALAWTGDLTVPGRVRIPVRKLGEYKPWTNHGRNMDDPWTTGFYSSGAALASRFIAQSLRG